MLRSVTRMVSGLWVIMAITGLTLYSSTAAAAELLVGAASISITPKERVALAGQMHTRISNKVEAECIATALAIETRNADQSLEQVIFCSCDVVSLRGGQALYKDLHAKLAGKIPDAAIPKIILNATHTHTAPVLEVGSYEIPASGVMHPVEYRDFFLNQLSEVISQAWEKRAPARIAWGLGHAVVAHNRRAVLANGTSVMYGNTNSNQFREIEGSPDHGVEILYFWNAKDELIATTIDVSCPAQEVESRSNINADFWHPVREQLQAKHGKQLQVIAWCGAAGDQSPHLMYGKAGELRMQKLRKLDTLGEIARRIVATWEDVYEVVQHDKHSDVEFVHLVEQITLPGRKVSEMEANASRIAAEGLKDPKAAPRKAWFERVVKRYEDQQAGKVEDFEMVLHAIRIGDVAIVTNDFELFTDYGVQMKARSPAVQTCVIQLCGRGSYLPTANAVAGGGYSAVPQSNLVGPEGGQVLVEATVKAINELWKSAAETKAK